jgi:predicted LPLAT superfamily acyltransferase
MALDQIQSRGGPQTQRASHWASLGERGAAWGPVVLGFVYRVFGRGVCVAAMAPVIFYFFVTGTRQRRASIAYLRRVWAFSGRAERPGLWQSLQHFFAFGESLVDRFGAWTGQVDRANVDAIDGEAFEAMRDDARGTLILSAHVGATEIVRAIASRYQKRRISIVIHSPHAAGYNALIQRFAPQSQVSLIQAADFGVNTAVEISAAIERGEWVVIMGDRMPVHGGDSRSITVDFLGARAAFPQGPFVLAAALRCPVYTLFCVRRNGRYKAEVALLSDGVAAPRNQRQQALTALVKSYARSLEGLLQGAPYQWFNFYDYWADQGDGGAHSRDGKN